MDVYELADASTSLRWTLRVWNGICLLTAALLIVAGMALAISSTGDDIGDAVAGPLAALAFIGVIVLSTVWWVGRELVIVVARFVVRRRQRAT